MHKFHVFDSSAIVALVKKEPGYEVVMEYINYSIMSSVNFSEVVSILSRELQRKSIIELLTNIITEIIPFDGLQAIEVGMLYESTKHLGLSLGERACITLAKIKNLPVITADKVWNKLDIGVEIKNIR